MGPPGGAATPGRLERNHSESGATVSAGGVRSCSLGSDRRGEVGAPTVGATGAGGATGSDGSEGNAATTDTSSISSSRCAGLRGLSWVGGSRPAARVTSTDRGGALAAARGAADDVLAPSGDNDGCSAAAAANTAAGLAIEPVEGGGSLRLRGGAIGEAPWPKARAVAAGAAGPAGGFAPGGRGIAAVAGVVTGGATNEPANAAGAVTAGGGVAPSGCVVVLRDGVAEAGTADGGAAGGEDGAGDPAVAAGIIGGNGSVLVLRAGAAGDRAPTAGDALAVARDAGSG